MLPFVTPSGQHPKYDSVQLSLNMSHPLKYSPLALVFPSGQQPYVATEQFSAAPGASVALGGSVASTSGSQPFCFGPLASVTLSLQHPYLNFKVRKRA